MTSNKVCKKCGNKIPCRVIIDGRERVSGRRKFCLICRPYGITSGSKYGGLSDRRKHQIRSAVLRIAAKRKAELVKLAGGKCEKCGYHKCVKALSFHHKNPAEKKFPLNVRSICKGWDVVLDELKKCSLLCLNCHAEEEDRLDKLRIEMEIAGMV